MRADRGSPGDPTLHTDIQKDREEAAKTLPPCPMPWLAPIPSCDLGGPDSSISSVGPGWSPLPFEDFAGQMRLSRKWGLKLGPLIAHWGAGIWGLEALQLLWPQFPHFYKATEGKRALRDPPCPDFPPSPLLLPCVQPQLSSIFHPF